MNEKNASKDYLQYNEKKQTRVMDPRQHIKCSSSPSLKLS